MDSKQTFCTHLDMIVGILTVIILISEFLPFTTIKHNGIAHMLYLSLKKKQEEDIETQQEQS